MAKGEAVVATNKKAFHDYEILEVYEVGLALFGTEVKALRNGKANLREAYARVEGGEVWLIGCHISPYTHGNRENHDPLRKRKCLLHRSEINRLIGKVQEKGLTLVPLRVYFKGGRAKAELAVGKGKKLHDKRHAIKIREAKRELDQALKASRR